jgi:SAM-dependent methyltransferase
MTTNFGAAAEDYARFRAGFPDSLFDRLRAFGIGAAGETVVDVGTGTGTLARGFALRGCKVMGIDPDERLLIQARQLDSIASVAIDYKVGRAEAIPLGDQSADIVSAGQCWHWFDGPRAAREIGRITLPRGRIVVAYFSWLPWPGNVVDSTERLILKHNPKWQLGGGNGVFLESLPHLYAARFSEFETFSYDMNVAYARRHGEGVSGPVLVSAPASRQLKSKPLMLNLPECWKGRSQAMSCKYHTGCSQ